MNQVRYQAKMVEVMCDSRTEWGKSRWMDGQTDKQVETHNPSVSQGLIKVQTYN